MAGLSIARRRKAWLDGVACGAGEISKCRLLVPKLKDIYQRGMEHGRAHQDTPYVRAIVEQEQRRRRPKTEKPRPMRGMRRPNSGGQRPGARW